MGGTRIGAACGTGAGLGWPGLELAAQDGWLADEHADLGPVLFVSGALCVVAPAHSASGCSGPVPDTARRAATQRAPAPVCVGPRLSVSGSALFVWGRPVVLSRRSLRRAPAVPGAACIGSLCWAPPLSRCLLCRAQRTLWHRKRRGPTQRAPGRNTESDRVPGPDSESARRRRREHRKSAGPRHRSAGSAETRQRERESCCCSSLLAVLQGNPSGQQNRDCVRSPNWVPGGVRLDCLLLVPTSLRFGACARVADMLSHIPGKIVHQRY